MRKLVERMLEREQRQLSVLETIGWWEWRRIPFNILVGCSGAISIVSGVLTALLTKTECGIPDSPLFAVMGIVLYGIAANIFYTGGWLAELILRRYVEPRIFAQGAFVIGLLLSVLLTISPAFFIPIVCSIGAGARP